MDEPRIEGFDANDAMTSYQWMWTLDGSKNREETIPIERSYGLRADVSSVRSKDTFERIAQSRKEMGAHRSPLLLRNALLSQLES